MDDAVPLDAEGPLLIRLTDLRLIRVAGAPLYAPETGAQSCGNLVLAAPTPQGGHEVLAVMPSTCADLGEIHLGAPDGARLSLLPLPYNFD